MTERLLKGADPFHSHVGPGLRFGSGNGRGIIGEFGTMRVWKLNTYGLSGERYVT